MTLLLAPPLADLSAGLHACLDELAVLDFGGLDGAGQADLLRSLTRAEARLAALKLGVIAGADRAGTAVASGAADTGQWAAKVANTDAVVAHRQVGLAQGLERRTSTRQALAAGSISTEHAAVIVQADRNLPAHVSAA